MMKQRWGLDRNVLRPTPGDPFSFYRGTWGRRRGVRHVAKHSSKWPPGSLPRSQSSGTGPSASCGYCCPFAHGGRYPGKSRFMEPQGENRHRRSVPGAASIGTPQESQFVLSRNLGYKISGVAMWQNVACPEVKVQVRNLVRVVGIVAPFAPRVSVIGKNSFYHATGGKWAQKTCARCSQQRYLHGRAWARQSWGTGPCGDCRRVLWLLGPPGQYSGKKSFYRETWGTRRGVSPCG